VAIVIVFPQLVMVYKGDAAAVDSSKVKIEVQDIPPPGGAGEQDRELQQMFEKPGTGAPTPSAPEPVDPLERALREQERRDSK
jgi:hypothetical protein